MIATLAEMNPSTTVKFTGANLTPGNYDFNLPSLGSFFTISPTSVTVGQDGKLNAEINISFEGGIEEYEKTGFSLTIDEITKHVTLYAETDDDPAINVDKDSVALIATTAEMNPSTTVTFTGKNLTPGNYDFVLPSLSSYFTISPTSVTVGADYSLNAEINIEFAGGVVEEEKTSFSLTIDGVTKEVKLTGISETDPELNVDKDSIYMATNALDSVASATVTFTGKNLTPGTYNLVTPPLGSAFTITPTSVTVGQDGILNAEITATFKDPEYADDMKSGIGLTIDGINKHVVLYVECDLESATSLNIEQFVLNNGVSADIDAALAAAHIYGANYDALDSLNDEKANRNYPYLGLKLKKTDAALAFWLEKNSTLKLRFGNVGANFIIRINHKDSTLTNTLANTTTASDNVFEYTAVNTLERIEIICNSTKTLVLKQIMIDEEIQNVILPAIPTALDNTDAAVKAIKRIENGMLIINMNGTDYNVLGQTIR
ncbi:MAG: hypothetical protein J5761_03810 [Paludibacteraceae bacterium]|nr:hypothetical protein [Paludibacteraceae bacterium]